MINIGKSPLVTVALALLFLAGSLSTISVVADTISDIGPDDPPTRYSRLVTIDRIRWGSGGITQWDYLNYGLVNGTTVFEVTLKNNKLYTPVKDVELNFTVYWHGGIGSDTQRIMYRDFRLVDINGGIGTLSEPELILWKPQYAGTYLLNFSIHYPQDTRPITDIFYEQGVSIERGDGSSFRTGVWVGTGSWNCSAIDGWTSESSGGLPNHTWHISDHPIGKEDPTQHTVDGAYWVGNGSGYIGPTSGVYGLISPPIDLTIYDPDPTNPSEEGEGPKIYFAYKYKGNISPAGPSGQGAIRHFVKEVGDDEWILLSDHSGDPIIINDNDTMHSDPIWNYPKRTIQGSSVEPQPGLDISEYQGKMVQIKLEYTPSGIPETGYIIDDIILIGLQRVDITPFQILRTDQEADELFPGTIGRFSINITFKEGGKATTLRMSPVNASGSIDINNDIDIDPEELKLPDVIVTDIGIDITLKLNESAQSGPAHFTIRMIGGGIYRDVTFSFKVMARHALVSEISGDLDGPLNANDPPSISLDLRNSGNSREIVNYTFVSEDDLKWEIPRGRKTIDVGRSVELTGKIGIEGSPFPGEKNGFIVTSTGSLPNDATILDRINTDETGQSWEVHHLTYDLLQTYSLETISNNSTFIPILEPGPTGVENVTYTMIVMNYGNAPDLLTFSQIGLEEGLNISVDLPVNLPIDPGEALRIDIPVTLQYPVPLGRFVFTVTAHSSGVEDESNNSVDFILSIGREPLESGLYIINNSLVIEPRESIIGVETIIIFNVRSYGLRHQSPFSIVLEVDGDFALSRDFITSSTQDTNCQMTYYFEDPGYHNITVRVPNIEDQRTPDLDLVYSVHTNIEVFSIDLSIDNLYLRKSGKDIQDGSAVDPGSYILIADIFNSGDIDAEAVSFIVNITDIENGETQTIYASLPIIIVNSSATLQVPDIALKADIQYSISLELDQNVNWRDTDDADNFRSITINVGPDPPTEPIWRNSIFILVGLGFTLLILGVIFLYTMRRKSR